MLKTPKGCPPSCIAMAVFFDASLGLRIPHSVALQRWAEFRVLRSAGINRSTGKACTAFTVSSWVSREAPEPWGSRLAAVDKAYLTLAEAMEHYNYFLRLMRQDANLRVFELREAYSLRYRICGLEWVDGRKKAGLDTTIDLEDNRDYW